MDARVDANALQFDLSRTAGPDAYGSALVDVAVVDTQTGETPIDLDGRSLGTSPMADISNRHIVEVHVGQRSLVVPLGARRTYGLISATTT